MTDFQLCDIESRNGTTGRELSDSFKTTQNPFGTKET